MNGGEIIARVLQAQGVHQLFTLCGGHISPILVACKRLGIRVLDTRHEATAVFAADAAARLGGIPGVAAVTAGPGVTNTLTALQNARLAQSPLVVLAGATATVLRNRGALQDIDQLALVRSSVKWVARARRVRELEPLLRQAFHIAASDTPGPVLLECPVDLLYDETLVRGWYAGASAAPPGAGLAQKALARYLGWHLDRQFAGVTPPLEAAVPRQATQPPNGSDVSAAARALARARQPVLVIGSQALLEPALVPSLVQAVERLGVPAYLSGMARGLLGAAHPLQRRHKRKEALREADLVILAGVPCDFRLNYGQDIRRRAILIAANRSRRDLRLNRRPTIGALGDAGAFLRALAAASEPPGERWRAWHAQLAARDAVREAQINADAARGAEGVNPLALCRGIEAQLPEDSLVVADGGDFVGTASYIVRPRGPLRWLDPGVFGTLGVGAGFLLGAAASRPKTELWALFGDGALGYSLMEFDSFARHGIPLVAVVGNDAGWTQILREQEDVLKDDVGCRLAPTDYHAAAAALGGEGLVIRNDAEIAPVLRAARERARAGKAVLVNALLGRTDFRKGSISL